MHHHLAPTLVTSARGLIWKAVSEVVISLSSWVSPARSARADVRRLVEEGVALARGVVEELVDEGDRDAHVETVELSYRGVDYEIDVSARESRAMDRALAPYLKGARRVPKARRAPASRRVAGGRRAPAGRADAAAAAPTAREVRAWAAAQGISVSERGRVSADLMSRYRTAHNG
jgi:hypothetical protein